MAKKVAREIFGVVSSKDKKNYWTKIGITFVNEDGSENLHFNFFPVDPATTIQLREPRAKDDNK